VLDPQVMMDACASCHALRRELLPGFEAGARFLDFFEPVLLDGDEYYADGQIHAESYEWTSFLQSPMARAGVTCGDCHEPHRGGLAAEGNALCLRCHDAGLAAARHTHHTGGPGQPTCVGCHMPVTVYMQRDPRHDHAFGQPDPQATVELGVPNACGQCHAERGAPWAAARVREWHGPSDEQTRRRELAAAFTRARRGDRTSAGALVACLEDCPDGVRRASAARLLARMMDAPGVPDALERAAHQPDPLVRAAAVWALADQGGQPAASRDVLVAAAGDPVRLVRLDAAWGLRRTESDGSPESPTVAAALKEWRGVMASQADHPESHHTLGVFHADRGEIAEAEAAYRTALRLAPESVPSRYELALLLAERNDVAGGQAELERVRELAPNHAAAAYALGLLYGERENWEAAIVALKDCLKIDPLYPDALTELAHAYVKVGMGEIANLLLESAAEYPGARTEALRALVGVNLALGKRDTAQRWAQVARDADPALTDDPHIRDLLAP
jgi:predicted CXXCH cytochrome family protein